MTIFSNGGPPITADNANQWIQTYPTVAALRGQIGTVTSTGVPQQVYLQGGVSTNDGLQGPFYWNATSTAPDDAGATTVVPSGSVLGAWVRLSTIPGATVSNSVTAAAITTGVLLSLGSVTIPAAGLWLMLGSVSVNVTGGTSTSVTAGISTSPNSFSAANLFISPNAATVSIGVPSALGTFTAQQLIYLNVNAVFTGAATSSMSLFGVQI